MLEAEASRRTFHTLDGMRGLAALAVVNIHVPWMWGQMTMHHAYMAVDLFFLLSGFVLAHAYDRRFDAGMTTLQFMKARLIRLYPLYLAGVLFTAAWIAFNLVTGTEVRLLQLQPWTWEGLGTALGHNLFFFPSPQIGSGPPALYPLNIPAWSLLFEILINLAFVLVWPRLTTLALSGLVAALTAWIVWAGLAQGTLNAGYAFDKLDIATARVCFGFFGGVLIYRLRDRLTWLKVPPILLLAVMMAAFYYMPEGDKVGIYDTLCVVVLAPLLVFLGSRVEPGRLTLPLYSFGGLTSYAVYAIHYPLSYAGTIWFTEAGFDSAANQPVSGFIFLVALLAFAWVLDRYYDAPVRSWLAGLGRRRKPAMSPSGA